MFQTGLEPLLEKLATPQRMARLQALANHPTTNPNEAANARARMQEMQSRGLPPPAPPMGARAAASAASGREDTGQLFNRTNRNIASIPNVPKPPGLMRRAAGPLGWGAAAAGTAGLYGALKQHQDDASRDNLVYAPIQM